MNQQLERPPVIVIHDGTSAQGGTVWAWAPAWRGDLDGFLAAVKADAEASGEYTEGDTITVWVGPDEHQITIGWA